MENKLLDEVQKWAVKYDFSFQFWGEDDNNFFLYKDKVELTCGGGYETPQDCIKTVLSYIYRINRTPVKERAFTN